MKKVYLSILGVAVIGSSFAQVNVQSINSKYRKDVKNVFEPSKQNSKQVEKAVGTPVWGSDFTTAADWTATTTGTGAGSTVAGSGWNINAAVDGTFFTGFPITSVSGGNFAELWNGPSTGTSQNVTQILTTTNAIPITTNFMILNFLQYGATFNDTQEIYVSEDGTNFTLVGDNSDIPALTGSGGEEMANPTAKSINLSSYVSNTATQLWIRFSWTSRFPTSTSDLAWFTYGWMIDDVALTTLPDYDLSETAVLWGASGNYGLLPYYQTPLTQSQDVQFGGIIHNNGSNNQTDIVFTATGTGYAGASLASTVNSGAFDTVWVDNDLPAPTAVGTKTITFDFSSGAIDDLPLNDNTSSSVSFETTEFVYARDNGTADGTENNSGLAYEVGNVFDIFANQTLYSVDINLNNTSNIGALVFAVVYEIDPATGDFNEIDRTDDHEIVAGEFNNFITLELQNTSDLIAGSVYLVTVGTDAGDGADAIINTAGESEEQTSFYKDETGEWFYTTSTPMVRMNFQDATGIKELANTVGMNIFPNPSAAKTNVSINLKNDSDVTVTVTDVTGKTVYTNNFGTMTNGQHNVVLNTESYTSGVYYVTVSTNDSQVTRKLIRK